MITLFLTTSLLAQVGGYGGMTGTNPFVFRDVVMILCGIVGGVFGMVSLGWQIFGRRRRDFPPVDSAQQASRVPPTLEYVSVQDHEDAQRSIADRITRLEVLVVEIRREGRTDREHLSAEMLILERRIADSAVQRDANTHLRINDLVKSVSELVGAVGQLATEVHNKV